MFSQGEPCSHIIQTPQSNTGCIKYVIIFRVVVNNKTIHALTSRDCYLYWLKLFKNFNYRYCLLTIYTGQRQFYLHVFYFKEK